MRFLWGLLGLALPTIIYADVLNTEVWDEVLDVECLVLKVEVNLLQDSPIATEFCESLLAPVTTTTSTTCVLANSDYIRKQKRCILTKCSTKTHSSCAYTYSVHQVMAGAQSMNIAAAQVRSSLAMI